MAWVVFEEKPLKLTNWFLLWNFQGIAQISCFEISNFSRIVTAFKITSNIANFQNSNKMLKKNQFLHEKKIRNQFRLWSNLEKLKFFTAEIAGLKTSKFSQTDSVDEMNWLTSKIHCSISWLEKLDSN